MCVTGWAAVCRLLCEACIRNYIVWNISVVTVFVHKL